MTVHIELLVVSDCPHAAAAADLLATAIADTGVRATVVHTTVTSKSHAQRRGFVGSPTILLNGIDPFTKPGADVGLACRLYWTPEGLRGVPDLRDLRQALKREAATPTQS